MEVIVKKNSSKTISFPVIDITDWASCLQSAVVTFSMLDVSNGCYIVANRSGNFYMGTGDGPATDACNIQGITLTYDLTPRQTKNIGVFRGEFRVDFISNGVTESRIYPVTEKLDIIIIDSITTTTAASKTPALSGLPVLLPPSGADCCVFQLAVGILELENLALNNNLKPGLSYGVTMGNGIILVVTAASLNTIMPFGQLITNGIATTDIIKTDINQNLLNFSVFTGMPSIIRGGSARNGDFPSDARYTYY